MDYCDRRRHGFVDLCVCAPTSMAGRLLLSNLRKQFDAMSEQLRARRPPNAKCVCAKLLQQQSRDTIPNQALRYCRCATSSVHARRFNCCILLRCNLGACTWGSLLNVLHLAHPRRQVGMYLLQARSSCASTNSREETILRERNRLPTLLAKSRGHNRHHTNRVPEVLGP